MKLKMAPQSTCPHFEWNPNDDGFLLKEFHYPCTPEGESCTEDSACCEKICGTFEQSMAGTAASGTQKKCVKCAAVDGQCLHHRDCCTGKCAGSTGSKTCANW